MTDPKPQQICIQAVAAQCAVQPPIAPSRTDRAGICELIESGARDWAPVHIAREFRAGSSRPYRVQRR
jgi:hypothetical protein